MQRSKLTAYLLTFLGIWSIWGTWNALEPVLSSEQISLLFLFLPISALLLALSFFDDTDDDDFGGGVMQPILQRAKP